MNMFKWNSYTLKPEAYPELTAESRDAINEAVPCFCYENAKYGFKQGVVKTLAVEGVCALATLGGVELYKYLKNKKANKQVTDKD